MEETINDILLRHISSEFVCPFENEIFNCKDYMNETCECIRTNTIRKQKIEFYSIFVLMYEQNSKLLDELMALDLNDAICIYEYMGQNYNCIGPFRKIQNYFKQRMNYVLK